MFTPGKEYVANNVTITAPQGRLKNFTKVQLEMPDVVTIENGLRVEKYDKPVQGTITGLGWLCYSLVLPYLKAGGMCWQTIKPMPLLNIHCMANDTATNPLPWFTTLSSVIFKMPSSFEFDRAEGSQDSVEFPFIVQGQVVFNGAKVFAHIDAPGL